MAASPAPTAESRVRSLYDQLLNSWNCQDAAGFAALFCADGEMIDADGGQLAGREEIAAALRHRFAEHPAAAYVAIVRTIRFPSPDTALLRAAVGMVPPGRQELDPDATVIQTLAAAQTPGGWRVMSFQNTPARFPGRPEQADALLAELGRNLKT